MYSSSDTFLIAPSIIDSLLGKSEPSAKPVVRGSAQPLSRFRENLGEQVFFSGLFLGFATMVYGFATMVHF